jgi:hypothetical protein
VNRSLLVISILGVIFALAGAILPIYIDAFDAFPQMVIVLVIASVLCFYYVRQHRPYTAMLFARYSSLIALIIQTFTYATHHLEYHGEIAFFFPLLIFSFLPASKEEG